MSSSLASAGRPAHRRFASAEHDDYSTVPIHEGKHADDAAMDDDRDYGEEERLLSADPDDAAHAAAADRTTSSSANPAQQTQPPPTSPPKNGPVTWMSLPRKDQLAILFLCRFVDFFQVAALQAYVFYQLKSFDSSLSDAHVSTQAGVLQGCFTGAQMLTAVMWGKAADAPWCGRKAVLLIGLGGTAVSCVGYGFATSFFWAAFWRAVGGGINGTVGIIRTMISEIIKDKRYQSRAFLILPMSFNLANILGPIVGGFLADPVENLPGFLSGDLLALCPYVTDYPYALPSILNALLLGLATCVVFFCLEETSKERQGKFDLGLDCAWRFKRVFGSRAQRPTPPRGYAEVAQQQQQAAWDGPGGLLGEQQEAKAITTATVQRPARPSRKLPFSRIWTRNVVLTLVTTAFYDFHLGAFSNLWALFLSTPRTGPAQPAAGGASAHPARALLGLKGGLGMPPSTVGVASSFLGILGMFLQVTLYPPINARLGTLRSFRYFLIGFPIAYFLAPYLVALPSSTAAPEPASGTIIWIGVIVILLMQVTARTFTLPASIILLNNCSPHPSVLGTVHGLGQSVSAGFRTVGPIVGGWWYGIGLNQGKIELGWWLVSMMSALGCGSAMWIREGNGHEIILEGEEDIEL